MVDRIQVTGPRVNVAALRDDLYALQSVEMVAISEQDRNFDPLAQTRQVELVDLVIAFSLNIAAGVSLELAKATLLPILRKYSFRQIAPKPDAAGSETPDGAD